ncbi:hypothetical protein D3C78_963070 [compost metagenome]
MAHDVDDVLFVLVQASLYTFRGHFAQTRGNQEDHEDLSRFHVQVVQVRQQRGVVRLVTVNEDLVVDLLNVTLRQGVDERLQLGVEASNASLNQSQRRGNAIGHWNSDAQTNILHRSFVVAVNQAGQVVAVPDVSELLSTYRDGSVLQSQCIVDVLRHVVTSSLHRRVDLVTGNVEVPSDSLLQDLDDLIHYHVVFNHTSGVLGLRAEHDAFFDRHLKSADVRVGQVACTDQTGQRSTVDCTNRQTLVIQYLSQAHCCGQGVIVQHGYTTP